MTIESYLRRHCEALVKDVGVEAACAATGRSKATLGRYYSEAPEHADRFMPVDVVARLEAVASFPHVTTALADLCGITLSLDVTRHNAGPRGLTQDMVVLAQRFALLMGQYADCLGDGRISHNEAMHLLRETLALQEVLMEMKLNLETEVSRATG